MTMVVPLLLLEIPSLSEERSYCIMAIRIYRILNLNPLWSLLAGSECLDF